MAALPRKTQRKSDWNALFESLRSVYRKADQQRMVAALDNHKENREAICRKLGVVCEADVSRIASSLRKSARA